MTKNILFYFSDLCDDFTTFELIKKLENICSNVYIFESEVARKNIPHVFWKKYFVLEKKIDLCIIFSNTNKSNQEISFKQLIEKKSINCLNIFKNDFLNKKETIISSIELILNKNDNLKNYSFLITTGSFNSNLDDQHYISCYNRNDLVQSITKSISMQGGHVDIISKNDIKAINYANEIFYIETIKEYESIFKSKSFKYDIIIDSMKIPRFALPKEEKIKIEYKRYFAELKENYLFLNDQEISKNQIIIRLFDGYEIPIETIEYYFKNIDIHSIISSEIDQKTFKYKKYFKIYEKEKSSSIFFYDNIYDLGNILVAKTIKFLEGKL